MITIEVTLYATLRKLYVRMGSAGPLALSLDEGTTLAELLNRLGIAPYEAKLTFVNGIQRDVSHILENKDQVGIFPPIAGGSRYCL